MMGVYGGTHVPYNTGDKVVVKEGEFRGCVGVVEIEPGRQTASVSFSDKIRSGETVTVDPRNLRPLSPHDRLMVKDFTG